MTALAPEASAATAEARGTRPRGLFVTGTGTGVGKTVVSALLMARQGITSPVRYWKPVQTGTRDDDDTAMVAALSGCGAARVEDDGVRLPLPLSPHEAARLAGTAIDVPALVGQWRTRAAQGSWVVEGAGGVLVPLDDETLMVDVIRACALPALVVGHSGLGTINHTLLTLEALRARAVPVAAVVLVGEAHSSNAEAIGRIGGVSVVVTCPALERVTPATVQATAQQLIGWEAVDAWLQ